LPGADACDHRRRRRWAGRRRLARRAARPERTLRSSGHRSRRCRDPDLHQRHHGAAQGRVDRAPRLDRQSHRVRVQPELVRLRRGHRRRRAGPAPFPGGMGCGDRGASVRGEAQRTEDRTRKACSGRRPTGHGPVG
jgi:hypothetical protein